jgi:hypothetical protein
MLACAATMPKFLKRSQMSACQTGKSLPGGKKKYCIIGAHNDDRIPVGKT